MRKYFCVWKKLAVLAIGSYLSNRIDAVSFFIGKIIRFSFFLLLIITIFQLTPTLAGYTKYEIILFFYDLQFSGYFAASFVSGCLFVP